MNEFDRFDRITQELKSRGFVKAISEEWLSSGLLCPYEVWVDFEKQIHCVLEGSSEGEISTVRLWGNLSLPLENFDNFVKDLPNCGGFQPFQPDIAIDGIWRFSVDWTKGDSCALRLKSFLEAGEQWGQFIPWVKKPFIWLVRYDEQIGDYDFNEITEKRLQAIEQFRLSG